MSLHGRLEHFAHENSFLEKGPLSVAVQITDDAKALKFPLDKVSFYVARGGQVKGLSGSKLKKILAKFGILKTLTSEGARTSRGSIDNMGKYVDFLNEASAGCDFDLGEIMNFWIDQVRMYFDRQPFTMNIDHSHSYAHQVRGLIDQARKREKESPGATYVGAMMQHLVGAKLQVVLKAELSHHGYSVADAPSGRPGDFFIADTAIHVTSAPTEELIAKCMHNLKTGRKALIVTLASKTGAARGLLENQGIDTRVDLFSIEEFLAANLSELGGFSSSGGRAALRDIVDQYNVQISESEADQSLRIDVG